jgi:LPPG:FO 2-phospho-L-lactate transferase
MRIVALAGGVGGAKLAHGFSKILPPDSFAVIVNTGDDFNHFGLAISPDIDTVCYTLAEESNPVTGWGRKDETFNVFDSLRDLEAPDWFMLGDKDLAVHLERTRLLAEGHSLSEITERISQRLGVKHAILPMTDSPVRTIVNTQEHGELPFQEYFVKYHFSLKTMGFRLEGIEKAVPTPSVISHLMDADLIVICPSNPYVSINPIISLPGVREILKNKFVVGVSPIIGGKAVKGPLGRMLEDRQMAIDSKSIIGMYKDFLDVFIIDEMDTIDNSTGLGSCIMIYKEKILLPDVPSRKELASKIIDIYENRE